MVSCVYTGNEYNHHEKPHGCPENATMSFGANVFNDEISAAKVEAKSRGLLREVRVQSEAGGIKPRSGGAYPGLLSRYHYEEILLLANILIYVYMYVF